MIGADRAFGGCLFLKQTARNIAAISAIAERSWADAPVDDLWSNIAAGIAVATKANKPPKSSIVDACFWRPLILVICAGQMLRWKVPDRQDAGLAQEQAGVVR
jgi:hypothetical protein